MEASDAVGREITAIAIELLRPYAAESYGKGAIVGLSGEQEHGVAMLTTVFGNVMREAAGGGKAWISSMTKRAGPGAAIDIPLAHKDALYVRSHYDGISLTLPDAPLPDEIAIICAYSNRERLNSRVGGLSKDKIKGVDGLVVSAPTADLSRGSHDGYLQDRRRAHQVAARRPRRLYRRRTSPRRDHAFGISQLGGFRRKPL